MPKQILTASSAKKNVKDNKDALKDEAHQKAVNAGAQSQLKIEVNLNEMTKKARKRLRNAIAKETSEVNRRKLAAAKAPKKSKKRSKTAAAAAVAPTTTAIATTTKTSPNTNSNSNLNIKAPSNVPSSKPNSSKSSNSNAGNSQVQLGFIASKRSAPLTGKQMARLQEAILDVTVSNKTNLRPQYDDCIPQSEWLLLVCANKKTANWIKDHFNLIRKRSRLEIDLLEENQIPRHVIEGYFPNSTHLPDDKILALINAQNPIQTQQWRILRRSANGSTLHLSIAIDGNSKQTLVARGGNICYCFGRICLNLNNYTADVTCTSVHSMQHQLNESKLDLYNQVSGSEWNLIMDQLDSVFDGVNNVRTPNNSISEWNAQFNCEFN
ncbi:PREDICTED: uncharacterized protein LOC108609974 [Drosophila arizonae]|uniref:Uncharacterized protein LOC108609974 n=1 Tax=Drosophila arizonae TaxID=7263 RepID=A0ABM1NQM8_DROAR|nr:PREDICTED: uncharacterized protein LOC108609974 [Drosophila arizonae]